MSDLSQMVLLKKRVERLRKAIQKHKNTDITADCYGNPTTKFMIDVVIDRRDQELWEVLDDDE